MSFLSSSLSCEYVHLKLAEKVVVWVEFLDIFQFVYLSEDSTLNASVCRWVSRIVWCRKPEVLSCLRFFRRFQDFVDIFECFVLSSAKTLRAAELSGWSCLASWGDSIVNSATFAFFLRVKGLGEVLVTRIAILEFVTVDSELATTSWWSPEYCSVAWILPVVFVMVRRLMPASIVMHWWGMMVSWFLMVTL